MSPRLYVGNGLYVGRDDDERTYRALPAIEVSAEERRQFNDRIHAHLAIPLECQIANTLKLELTRHKEKAAMGAVETVTMKEAAGLAGVSEAAVRLWAKDGKIHLKTEPRTDATGREKPTQVVRKAELLAYAHGRTEAAPARKTPARKTRRERLDTAADVGRHSSADVKAAIADAAAARPQPDRRMPKVLTPDDAEWLLLEQASNLIGMSKAAVQDYIASGDLTMLPGSPVVLVRRLDAENLKRKLTGANDTSGPLAPMVDRLSSVMQTMNGQLANMQTELSNNSKEIRALREMLPGFLEMQKRTTEENRL